MACCLAAQPAVKRPPIVGVAFHVGVMVQDRVASDPFIKTSSASMTDWIDLRVPEGTEYMMNARNPSPRTRGVMNHLSLGVPNVEAAHKALVEPMREQPMIGRDGK